MNNVEFNGGLKPQSGFVGYEPLKPEDSCMAIGHNPPPFIVLRAGVHTYKCPSCGKVTVITVPLIQ